MTQIVHLIRHGEHDEVGKVLSGRSEITLNENGRAQARALVAMFEGAAIASIHSSPRRRAWETSLPLAQAHCLAIAEAPALDEIDFGAFTGRSFAALDADPDWGEWNMRRGEARCPDGETMAEAVARAVGYLVALPRTGGPAVCVTHCDIIRGVVADQLGLPLDRLFALACDTGSVTTLAFERQGVRLVTLNALSRR